MTMNRFFAASILTLGLVLSTHAQAGHEYAPIQEKTVNYKDWTYNDLKGGPVHLRDLVRGKKLVMVVYFAPWCGNWRNQAPVATSFYEKYKDKGFELVAVGEYGSADEVRAFWSGKAAPFTVVTESDSRDARDKTLHFGYRQNTGDTRKWGSPWTIFLDPAALKKTGDVLAEKTWIANGELIDADAEKFIREHLGLEPLDTKSANASDGTKVVTPCEPAKVDLKSKKP
jgi:thiol-disulfide isomerase/thioredoxin